MEYKQNKANARTYDLTADQIVEFFTEPRQAIGTFKQDEIDAIALAFRKWRDLMDPTEIEAPVLAFLQASSFLFDTNKRRDELNDVDGFRLYDLSYFARPGALAHIHKQVSRFLGHEITTDEASWLFYLLCSLRR